jgi:diaminopimelate epimerase
MPNKISFIKYHSLQNDFIIINENQLFSSKHARALCARHSGVGADGILFYQATDDPYHFTFLVQNADGSDGGFSGNGARCLAAYLFEKYEINEVFLATRTQKIRAIKQDGLVMTKVRLGNVVQEVNIIVDQQEFQAFYVEVGNPHLLFFNTMKTDFFLSNIAAIQKQLAFEQNISLISSTDNGFFYYDA